MVTAAGAALESTVALRVVAYTAVAVMGGVAQAAEAQGVVELA